MRAFALLALTLVILPPLLAADEPPVVRLQAAVLPMLKRDAAPQRYAITTPVSADLEGTVVDALRELAKAAGDLCWVCGIPPKGELKKARFKVKDEPLWQALDRLRAVYGYDWGINCGALIAWPTMEPVLDRETPPDPPENLRLASVDGESPVLLDAPTPIATAVRACWAPAQARGLIVTIHDDLAGWSVAGELNHGKDYNAGYTACAAAAATGGLLLGAYPYIYVRPSPLRCLDAAIKYLKAHPELREQPTETIAQWLRVYTLKNHYSAQHRRLATSGLEATVAFWELSPKEAALFLEVARRVAEAGGQQLDLRRPHLFCIRLNQSAGRQVFKGKFMPNGRTRTEWWVTLTISVRAPLLNGRLLSACLPGCRASGG